MSLPLHQGTRQLFSLLRVARGQSIEITTGNDVTIRPVHWTSEGTRPCQSKGGELPCPHCLNPLTPPPRVTIYLSAWPHDDWRPHLLILSELAVPWAIDGDDLVRRHLILSRGKKTNRLMTINEGPADRETPGQPMCRWLATLWNMS